MKLFRNCWKKTHRTVCSIMVSNYFWFSDCFVLINHPLYVVVTRVYQERGHVTAIWTLNRHLKLKVRAKKKRKVKMFFFIELYRIILNVIIAKTQDPDMRIDTVMLRGCLRLQKTRNIVYFWYTNWSDFSFVTISTLVFERKSTCRKLFRS